MTKYERTDLLRTNGVSRNYRTRMPEVLRTMKEMPA